MSNPIIKVKRVTSDGGRLAVSTGATSTLNHGEIAVIFPNPLSTTPSLDGETVYIGNADGSAVAVGGSGTFATRQYVDDKVTSVFVYKGKISAFFGASPSFPLDLDATLSQVTGSYYSIDSDYPGNPNNDNPGVVGTDKNAVAVTWLESGGSAKTILVKLGDSIVKTATGWEKFDNVDVQVHNTVDETAVTGDENTGYTVGLATAFKNRVSALEDKAQNIDAATEPELTVINGKVKLSGEDGGSNSIDITLDPEGHKLVFNDGANSVYINSGSRDVVIQPDINGNWTNNYNSQVSQGGSGENYAPVVKLQAMLTKVTGNLVGNGTTSKITDFIIDGGEF